MKQNKLFLGLATMFAAAFAFTACSSDDAETQSTQQDRTIRLVSTLEKGGTRSTTDPQSGTSLSTSSNLAIWAINQSGSAALTNGDNEQYSVNNSGSLTPKTEANTMTWPEGATLDFYAYAPYNSGYSYNAANSFSVQTDQSTEANYLASDLVLAQATGKNYNTQTPAVALSFKHLMSKINITIQKADGAQVDLSKAKVTITNTKLKTNFKPSATDESSDKILTEVTTDNDAADILAVSALGAATTACAIIVPQDIAAGTALVKIETTSEATSGANRTLIAKLSAATTFASGQSYNFTVTVNDQTTPSFEPEVVELTLGSPQLVVWGDNNLEVATEEVYVAGDYVLKDGSLVHKDDLTDNLKPYVRAIVFTNSADELRAEDKTAGYVGYAMSVVRMGSKQWLDTESREDAPSTFAASLEMKNGMTKTSTLQTAWSGNESWGNAFVNFTNFTSSSNPLEASSLVSSESGKKNLSGWFAPAFGQMVMILNNLGNAGITSTLENVDFSKGSGDFYASTSSTVLSTINGLVNTDLGKTNLFANGYVFTTVTENGTSFFYVKVTDNDLNYGLGKTAGKSTGGRSVLPIVAFKLPAE